MNTKIKNYVEVLFSDIPNTKKAVELKQELLSTLNDHFEAHIQKGESENQAYTNAVAELGDIDELLAGLKPAKEISEKINDYKKFKARNTAIAVMLYILGAAVVVGMSSFPAILGSANSEKYAIAGVLILLVMCAAATGLLIYTKMSLPQDIEPYVTQKANAPEIRTDTKAGVIMASFLKLYWLLVVIVYLFVSFTFSSWHISWLIFLIGAALREGIILFYRAFTNDSTDFKD